MKFGKVDHPELVDFTLPSDHSLTTELLSNSSSTAPELNIGCAKWNRQDLKNFYPRGTKDELAYYSTQFNSIELNAFFYRIFPPEQVKKWKEKSDSDFQFFPKVPQVISQFKRLKNVQRELDEYLDSVAHFEEKLGMCFLQMHPTFSPKSFDSLEAFIELWPSDFELSVELRHPDWYADEHVFDNLCSLLTAHNVTHTITDTAGRRDLVHMCLTTPKCFIRYTGANHKSDYARLDDWVDRLVSWSENGIEKINFFVHQNLEQESPLLTAYLNQELNKRIGSKLIIPRTLNTPSQTNLF
mgnify:CR=1 FL=1